MACKRCAEPLPPNYAARKCAFDDAGNFVEHNWNCGTINELRNLMEEGYGSDYADGKWSSTAWRTRYEDCSFGVLLNTVSSGDFGLFPDGLILLHWYKDRGGCDHACLWGYDGKSQQLTLQMAEAYLDAIRKTA